MTLAGVRVGDIVQCDIRGDVFYALVDEKGNRELTVLPISNGRSPVRLVKSNQVKTRWKRMGC